MERVFSLAILFSIAIAGRAAISVEPETGTGILPFNAVPPVTQWSSRNALPNNGALVTTVAGLDQYVQTNIPPTINTPLPTTTDGAQNNNAAFRSGANYIYTRPTGNTYQLLMGQFTNHIGDSANQLIIDFDSTTFAPPAGTEEAQGWRVYYSLSSSSNNWIVIPELSGFTTNGHVKATVNLASNWLAGATLYLLFADDNANSFTDTGYSIDNFSMIAIPSTVVPITITNSPQNLTVDDRGTAVFSVGASGSPKTYYWYYNGSLVPGNNQPTYTKSFARYPEDNNVQVYVVVSNSASFQTSGTATLTVTPDTTPPMVLSAVLQPGFTTIIVSFSEPMSPTDPSGFGVFVTGTNPDDTAEYPITADVSNGTNFILTFTTALTAGQNYSMRVSEAYDTANNPGGNVVNPNPTTLPVRVLLRLIGFDPGTDNLWKYSTETNLFGTGWETVGYDDTTPIWVEGVSPLGEDNTVNPNVPPIASSTAYPNNSSAPQFFRRHFYLPASTNGLALSMRYVFEDGGVVYLNGEVAGRFNVPADPLSVTSRAPSGRGETDPTSGPLLLPLTNVFAGDNVIAVVVLQNGGGSTDIEMAVELMANIPAFAAGPVVINVQPQSQTVTEGANVTLGVSADGALPILYQWRKGGIAIPGATNPLYKITGVLPTQAGSYDVLITNSINDIASSAAILGVTADTTAPVILSAIGSTNLSSVAVTLYDAGGFDLTTLQTAANYQIHLTAGGGDLTVLSATAATSGTNIVVTLVTSAPRTAGENYTVVVNLTDRSAAHNPVTPNTAPIAATVVLFSFNNTWRYDQTGTDLGTIWKDTGFNDSAWPSGPGVLGFETTAATLMFLTNIAPPNATNTVLSLTNGTGAGIGGTNVTFYFRTTVNLASFNPAAATMTMRGYIDDGAILYINGIERLRVNYTNAPAYTNFANGASTEAVLVVSNLTGFVQGNNVIAVEVHQDGIASSDIDWGMQLEAQVTSFVPVGPTLFTSVNGNNLTITWSGGGTLQRSADISAPDNWQNIIGAASPFQTNTTATALQFFRVTVP